MDVYYISPGNISRANAKGVKPMTFRKNMHDGIKVPELEERRRCRK